MRLASRPDPELLVRKNDYWISRDGMQSLSHIWRHIEPLSFMLDDSIHDPYIFGQILASPNTLSFTFSQSGQPQTPTSISGIMWAYSISPGFQGGCGMAAWGLSAMGRVNMVRKAMLATVRSYNLHRLFSVVAEPNHASHKLMERLGFRINGEIPEGVRYNGEWTTAILYGILAREIEDSVGGAGG